MRVVVDVFFILFYSHFGEWMETQWEVEGEKNYNSSLLNPRTGLECAETKRE
jgi:hypothetical protein